MSLGPFKGLSTQLRLSRLVKGSTGSFLRLFGAASELPERQRHLVRQELQRRRLMKATQEAVDRAVEEFTAL